MPPAQSTHQTAPKFFTTSRFLLVTCLVSGAALVLFGGVLTKQLLDRYDNIVLPGIFVGSVDVSGKNEAELRSILLAELSKLNTRTLVLDVDGQKFPISASQLNLSSNEGEVISQALAAGRENFWQDGAQRILIGKGPELQISPVYSFSSDKVRLLVEALKLKVDLASKEPSAVLAKSGIISSLSISNGVLGHELSAAQVMQTIQSTAALPDQELRLSFTSENKGVVLNELQLEAARLRATKLIGKQLTLKTPDRAITTNDQKLVGLLSLPSGVNQVNLTAYLSDLDSQVTRVPQNAQFEYDPVTLKVNTFVPPREGLKLDLSNFQTMLLEQLNTLELSESKNIELTLPLVLKKPEKSLLSTNSLGINERVGFGDSRYSHSAIGRIHNVALGAERVNNVIIKPGDEFSFIDAIGPISQATGYKQAYIIQSGRTVMGDGGGVCQVSTTVFRAIINAGLPVTARKAHSFRVSYYELNSKPGADAAVYPGSADLKFINDTGQHLLLHTRTDSKELYMTAEFYGTSDGRTTEVIDHKTWGYQGPGPAQYIDDPSLPPGRVKQVETAVAGVKASFKNVVKDKNGQIISEKEYVSNYVPWRAVFMRGI